MKILRVSETFWGSAVGIQTDEGFAGKIYDFKDIASMVPISPESGRSTGGAAAGVVTGALLLGPLGAVAGGLIGAGKNTVAVQVTMKNGRSFVAEISTKNLVKCAAALGK